MPYRRPPGLMRLLRLAPALLLIAAVMACTAARPDGGAAFDTTKDHPATSDERAAQRPHWKLPNPDSILPGSRVLTEAYGPHPLQQMDIYLPPLPPGTADAPVIIMVHGGSWKGGDKTNPTVVANKLRHWLPRGYVFVSVNYRLLPEALALEQAGDVAAAVRMVADNAARWGARADRMILMGHSAGAHLAALLSSRPDMAGRPVAGTVVLDSAALNIPEVMSRRHSPMYDAAFGSSPAYWAMASPATQWTPDAVPMLLVCSTRRPDNPCQMAQAFATMTERAGRHTAVLPQRLTHMDISDTLGTPGDYTNAVDAFITERLQAAERQ